jgi:hypothetical protein
MGAYGLIPSTLGPRPAHEGDAAKETEEHKEDHGVRRILVTEHAIAVPLVGHIAVLHPSCTSWGGCCCP